MRDIVITGEGIVSAIGNDKASVLQALLEGRSGIAEMRYLRSSHHELPVGEVKLSNEELKVLLGVDESEEMSRNTLLGILAVKQALTDAGVWRAGGSTDSRRRTVGHGGTTAGCGGRGSRIVLISGTTVGGMDITEQHFDGFTSSDELPYCLLKHDCGSGTKDIADYFGIFEESSTISTACSSSANALILGARLLKAGEADMVVAGGTEALTRFHLNGFRSLMILDSEPCRPFDEERAGLTLGEGAAFVVMETEASARSREVEIHGWLTGYGNACDAFHQTASSDDGEGAYRAMKEALAMAHLQPSDIDYVNAHGTGTPNNDLSESAALRRIFAGGLDGALQQAQGKRQSGYGMPRISSTKGFTGHTTSASGSIEAVICLLAMRHHFVPANIGWKRQMTDGITPTLGETGCRLRHILCNAFGFGGNDSSIVLSSKGSPDGEPSGTVASSTTQSLVASSATQSLVASSATQSLVASSATQSLVASSATQSLVASSATQRLAAPFDKLRVNLQGSRDVGVKVVASVEIADEKDLSDIKNYVKPLEARRMGKLMKSSLLASLKALEQAGIESPDAIITATALGCLENTEQLLLQLREEGEVLLKPTCFMQSTHNTLGSSIAIRTKCHGYNITYSHGSESLAWALRDAHLLLRSGKARNVLVGLHDESTPLFREQMEKLERQGLLGSWLTIQGLDGKTVKNIGLTNGFYSKVMILTCGR